MPLWTAAARHSIQRLKRTIVDRQCVALTLAPDLESHGAALDGWELPHAAYEDSGDPVAPMVAAELLAGWAATTAQRDPLVRWAVRGAKLPKTRAHEVTGLSRVTIDRIVSPGAA
ncbi:hypothetical protein [Streptomyces sp. NPDC058254]|uniref:hypothetical protein n=1 Tax=Streptomyces sp. NPDC058254 TaxID=3346406 RepID=UPI0036E0C955